MDLLFLIVVTGLIFSKLFKMLGKNDNDISSKKHTIDPLIAGLYKDCSAPEAKPAVDIEIASASEAALSQDLRDVFDQIRKIDPAFNLDHFYQGAKKAFEMVLKAFTNNDKDTLQHLLNKEVLHKFCEAIKSRQQQKIENTIVGINSIKVTDATFTGGKAVISVEIASDQINVARDASNKILSGHPTKISTISETWTFERDVKKDNIWSLTSTGA
jgi:predicted lipid-binding transport protein (Tim44 family)